MKILSQKIIFENRKLSKFLKCRNNNFNFCSKLTENPNSNINNLSINNLDTTIDQNISQNVRNYKTQLYLWNSSVAPGIKKNDIKSRLSLSYEPKRIQFFDDKLLKNVYCGIRHSGVLTEEGHLYMFGSNVYGGLGIGSNKDYSYFEPQLVKYFVDKDIKIKKFCCSDFNTIALSQNGDIYTWGYGGREARFFPIIKG